MIESWDGACIGHVTQNLRLQLRNARRTCESGCPTAYQENEDAMSTAIRPASDAGNDADLLGSAIRVAFTEFLVFNLQHMAKEEDIINKILWRYYSDDEIKAVGAQISQNTPPWMQDFYFKWMLRGISNNEVTGWIQNIKKGQPPIVVQTILQKAQQELPKKRYQKIEQCLKDAVVALN